MVIEKEAAGATSLGKEPSLNQVEPKSGKQYHEMPMTPVMLVRDTKVPPGTMRELPVQMPMGQEGIRLITPAYQHRDKEGPEHWTRWCLYPKAISLITEGPLREEKGDKPLTAKQKKKIEDDGGSEPLWYITLVRKPWSCQRT